MGREPETGPSFALRIFGRLLCMCERDRAGGWTYRERPNLHENLLAGREKTRVPGHVDLLTGKPFLRGVPPHLRSQGQLSCVDCNGRQHSHRSMHSLKG